MKLQKKSFFTFAIVIMTMLLIYYNVDSILYYYSDNSIRDILFKEIPNIKYVLKYSSSSRPPFMFIPEGQETFVKRKCSVTNCYITSDRYLLSTITAFHVVLFNGPHIVHRLPKDCLPGERLPSQSYIFVNSESSDNYYVPDRRYDHVFNYTWTYKLTSDIYYGYISVRNKSGKVIGPKENISWINVDDMQPIGDNLKRKLKRKRYAVAWLVSNCRAQNKREKWALRIDNELRKYNLSLDIYGACMYKRCSYSDDCSDMIQRDYYFYLAFENSMSDDYVTEKLLRALNNYAVPVVFGGADYRRFMPDGIYLNAREMSVQALVRQMVEAIRDKNKYYNYFKWHNHYSYHNPDESPDTDSFCELCDFINKKIKPNSYANVDNFFEWWNPHVIVPAQTKMAISKQP